MVWLCKRDDKKSLAKEIYEAGMDDNAERPRQTLVKYIDQVLKNGQVKVFETCEHI
jgi:hypothetical protein